MAGGRGEVIRGAGRSAQSRRRERGAGRWAGRGGPWGGAIDSVRPPMGGGPAGGRGEVIRGAGRSAQSGPRGSLAGRGDP